MAKEDTDAGVKPLRPVLVAKKKESLPEYSREVKLVHKEYQLLMASLTSSMKMASQYRVETQKPPDLRKSLIPIYKFLAGHIPDLFKTDEVTHQLLSDLNIIGYNPLTSEVKITYRFHHKNRVVLHRIKFKHERGPFNKFGKSEDWKVV